MKIAAVGHHGDVFLKKVSDSTELPTDLKELKPQQGKHVLQHGEALGNIHALPADPSKVRLFLRSNENSQRNLVVIIKEPVALTHEEHNPQMLSVGTYISKSKQELVNGLRQNVLD